MNTQTLHIADEALHLPVEARITLVDMLLQSLNTDAHQDVDALWVIEAEKRAHDLQSGAVQALDGEQAFAETRQRLHVRA